MTSSSSCQGDDLGELNPSASASSIDDVLHEMYDGEDATLDDACFPKEFHRDRKIFLDFDATDIATENTNKNKNKNVIAHDPGPPDVVAGTPSDHQASSVHPADEVMSAHGGEETPTEDSARILSEAEKTALCDSFKKKGKAISFHHLSLTFPHPESLAVAWGEVKSEGTFDKIAEVLPGLTEKNKPRLKNGVIVEEVVGGVKVVCMALQISREPGSKEAVCVPSFLKMLYAEVFREYHSEIQVHSNASYLEGARELVAPLEAREMDMEPCVFGDEDRYREKDLYALLRRIENTSKRAGGKVPIDRKWHKYPPGLLRAALGANRMVHFHRT